jgi:hypothetical protein
MRKIIISTLVFLAGSQLAYAKPKNITLISQLTSTQTLDLGKTGQDMGDIVVNMGDLLNPKTGEKIGSYVNRHILVNVDQPGGTDTRDISIQYTLPGGTISMTQIQTYSSATHLPITQGDRAIIGGTRKYSGVKGSQTFTSVNGYPGRFLIKLNFK